MEPGPTLCLKDRHPKSKSREIRDARKGKPLSIVSQLTPLLGVVVDFQCNTPVLVLKSVVRFFVRLAI